MRRTTLTTSLLLLAILVVSIIAVLPTVTSRYVGSHTWYEKPKCLGCHKYDEIGISDDTTTNDGPHQNLSTYTSVSSDQANKWCLQCHTNNATTPHGHNATLADCIRCHEAAQARMTEILWINQTDGAHRPLFTADGDGGALTYPTNGMGNDTKGCMACHTGIKVNITFSDRYDILIVNYNVSNGSVSFSAGGANSSTWTVQGTDKKG